MQSHMQSFTKYIVNMMKKEQLFASQGGNIILAQVMRVDLVFVFCFDVFATDNPSSGHES
jgi:hypothetical protein